jgi:hypothetical protein
MDPTLLTSVPGPVLDIGRELHERGLDAVLVGGAVRDALLGTASADWDLVTDAPAEEVRDIAARTGGVRSLYDVGRRFGTLGIALEDGGTLEVSRYRPDALPAATPGERFAADAAQRDFTINAIGVDLATGDCSTQSAAEADLARRLLRAPGDPAERFAEDPLRTIRAARFVAELGFELEDATRGALRDAARGLERIAPERVREELTRLLVAPFAPEGLRVLHESGALAVVLPEVAALDGVTQPTFHDLDVLAHTIQATGLAPPRRCCGGRLCCTTWARPRRAVCSPTAASASSGTRRKVRGWLRNRGAVALLDRRGCCGRAPRRHAHALRRDRACQPEVGRPRGPQARPASRRDRGGAARLCRGRRGTHACRLRRDRTPGRDALPARSARRRRRRLPGARERIAP